MILKKGFLFLIAFMNILIAMPQTTICGTVWDEQKSTIAGANIYLEGTYDGSSSEADGTFCFSTTYTDSVVLVGSFIGFNQYRQEMVLQGDSVKIEITLVQSASGLNTVVISAGSFEAGTGKSEVLRPLDIVTTAGATADIAAALNTLPGTQIVGEEGRLFVRGGDGYETTTFIDGMLVKESYDLSAPNVPTRSRFSPFMFSGTQFSTGGYSAEYGQGLSSALILNTKEVATETRSDFSFISVGLEAAHTQGWEKASLAGKLGYFNLDPYYNIIRQDIDWTDPPTTLDGNLAFRQKVGAHGMFKSYGKFSRSSLAFNQDPFTLSPALIHMRLQDQYGHLNASYKDLLSDKWTIRTGVSYTYAQDDIKIDNDAVREHTRGWHGKVVFGHQYSDRIFLRMGGEIITSSHDQDFVESETGFRNRFAFSERILSTFIETEWNLSRELVARLGGRIEYNNLQQRISADPRLSMALRTGEDSQLSLAYGHFRQSAPADLLRIAQDLRSEKATHYILNYQWMRDRRTFRVEAYWKNYQQLISFDPVLPYVRESYSNEGDGYARGIDLFYRDAESFRNIDFWISYGYLDTERAYRDFPVSASPTFTSKHNFSVVYKQFINSLRSQIGFTYSYASGRPYHDPNTLQFNGKRTPSYQDLSANVSYLATSQIIVYLSISNILNRENIFGYQYQTEPNSQGIYEGKPITLPAPRFLLAGVFVTLSKSKSVNQLPHL
ncbi:MAG: TonB-dependent receptor [Saprospiraceae bacterium]|nr:TonB-dependent receptor [Saprospiraceae bacterium]